MKRTILVSIGLGLGLIANGAIAQSKTEAPAQNQIIIKLSGFEHRKGNVRCALHREDDWLARPYKSAVAPISKELTSECMFALVKPGTYAIATYHDENNNGELDSNFIGIPKEGVGISNMKKMKMGKPSFEDAKFKYTGGRYSTAAPMLY